MYVALCKKILLEFKIIVIQSILGLGIQFIV